MNNFFVGYLATDFSFLTTSLGTLGFGALLSPLYFGEVRELFLHPERRWWRSKLRRRIPLPIQVDTRDSVKISGTTHDISETGAFLPLEVISQYLDGTVNICLTLSGLQQIHCEATVVRHNAARGTCPAGVGIQFKNLDWRQRRELKRYLASGARPHI